MKVLVSKIECKCFLSLVWLMLLNVRMFNNSLTRKWLKGCVSLYSFCFPIFYLCCGQNAWSVGKIRYTKRTSLRFTGKGGFIGEEIEVFRPKLRWFISKPCDISDRPSWSKLAWTLWCMI
jgi:hypothetical protein